MELKQTQSYSEFLDAIAVKGLKKVEHITLDFKLTTWTDPNGVIVAKRTVQDNYDEYCDYPPTEKMYVLK